MGYEKRALRSIFAFGVIISSIQLPYAVGQPGATVRASSTEEVVDDRVGQLFYRYPFDDPDLAEELSAAVCTTSYLGDQLWITAAHCVDAFSSFTGYIKQVDGDQASIQSVSIPRKDVDIALLRVGEGINAERFKLPSEGAEVGDQLTLIGYADERSYSSTDWVWCECRLDVMKTNGKLRRGVYETRALEELRSCSGTKGAPLVYAKDVFHAAHAAGDQDRGCI